MSRVTQSDFHFFSLPPSVDNEGGECRCRRERHGTQKVLQVESRSRVGCAQNCFYVKTRRVKQSKLEWRGNGKHWGGQNCRHFNCLFIFKWEMLTLCLLHSLDYFINSASCHSTLIVMAVEKKNVWEAEERKHFPGSLHPFHIHWAYICPARHRAPALAVITHAWNGTEGKNYFKIPLVLLKISLMQDPG